MRTEKEIIAVQEKHIALLTGFIMELLEELNYLRKTEADIHGLGSHAPGDTGAD